MSEEHNLSPWVHPKAKGWFKELFERTNLALALEDELNKPDDQLTPEVMRMILALGVMLGRPEIWPERYKEILKKVMRKAQQFSQNPTKSSTGKALSLAEHKEHTNANQEMVHELEILRRRLGISVRKTALGTPPSWEPFWE